MLTATISCGILLYMEQKGIFTSVERRAQFMQSLGTSYAALGGLFGAYREPREAFEAAKVFSLYKEVGIVEMDFDAFERAFYQFQELRAAMQVEKALAESMMSEILAETDLHGGLKVVAAKDVFELIAIQQSGKAKQEKAK